MANQDDKTPLSQLLTGFRIKREMEAIFKQTTQQVLNAALPPEIARAAGRSLLEEWEAQRARNEQKALAEAAAGTGPQPYDRDWYSNGCDIDHIVSEFDWHLTNDFLDLVTMAAHSAEGQRALAMKDDPANPRQHVLTLLLDLRRALVYRQRDLLFEQAKTLNWDTEELDEDLGEISEW